MRVPRKTFWRWGLRRAAGKRRGEVKDLRGKPGVEE